MSISKRYVRSNYKKKELFEDKNKTIHSDVCRESSRCGGGYCILDINFPRGYGCICENGRIQAEPCPFSKSNEELKLKFLSKSIVLAGCPIKNCGQRGICVETDGILLEYAKSKPIYYVCMCDNGYISSSNCDRKKIQMD